MARPDSFEQTSSLRFVFEISNLKWSANVFSEEFCISGSRWKLQYERTSIYVCPCVCLHKINSEETFLPFNTTSFVETEEQTYWFCRTTVVFKGWDSKFGIEGQPIWNGPCKLTAEDEDSLSSGAKLVILFTAIDPISEKGHKSTQTSSEMDNLSCLESLSTDFSYLLEGETQADVMLKCGDHATPAHKLILSARSEVFAAMFSNEMVESLTGSVDIVDMDQLVLDQLLQYMYTGKVSNLTVDSAQFMYAAGDKYAVHELKIKCRAFLMENLTEDTVYDLLVFSDIHSDQVLQDAAVELFVKNGELFESEAWSEFCGNQPSLALKVYRVCFAKISKSNKLCLYCKDFKIE